MKSLSEGYERAVDQHWDGMAKIGIFGPKKPTLLYSNHVLATTGKSRSKKKVTFSQIATNWWQGGSANWNVFARP